MTARPREENHHPGLLPGLLIVQLLESDGQWRLTLYHQGYAIAQTGPYQTADEAVNDVEHTVQREYAAFKGGIFIRKWKKEGNTR